jgi:hypothetical protein
MKMEIAPISDSDNNERWREIRQTHKKYKFFYQILGGAILVIMGIWVGAILFSNDESYKVNLYTEFIGIGVAVFIIDLLAKRREKNDLKRRLIRQMASHDNGFALQAVWELIAEKWVIDGSLEEQYFTGANLENAVLLHARLRSCKLTGANLNQSLLHYADLENADLTGASLIGAQLLNANLRKAHLIFADLREADLSGADMRGAYLVNAKLDNIRLVENFVSGESHIAIFDETTVLPDRSKYDSNLGLEQLNRFTSPSNEDFRN